MRVNKLISIVNNTRTLFKVIAMTEFNVTKAFAALGGLLGVHANKVLIAFKPLIEIFVVLQCNVFSYKTWEIW